MEFKLRGLEARRFASCLSTIWICNSAGVKVRYEGFVPIFSGGSFFDLVDFICDQIEKKPDSFLGKKKLPKVAVRDKSGNIVRNKDGKPKMEVPNNIKELLDKGIIHGCIVDQNDVCFTPFPIADRNNTDVSAYMKACTELNKVKNIRKVVMDALENPRLPLGDVLGFFGAGSVVKNQYLSMPIKQEKSHEKHVLMLMALLSRRFFPCWNSKERVAYYGQKKRIASTDGWIGHKSFLYPLPSNFVSGEELLLLLAHPYLDRIKEDTYLQKIFQISHVAKFEYQEAGDKSRTVSYID